VILGSIIAGDTTPPHNPLKSLASDFALSNDLQEGKKSTPVRSVALSIELANDRAGVEFFTEAGDEGACIYGSATLASSPMRTLVHTSATLTGWGGSGREGKGYPQVGARIDILVFCSYVSTIFA
jgi:hypothetical protein